MRHEALEQGSFVLTRESCLRQGSTVSGCRRDAALCSWLVAKQARRTGAHLGHCSFGLGRQLCRERRCSSGALCLSACPLPVSPATTRRNPPWARASSLTTCNHASVPIKRTSAPWTALAWMTTSPKGTLPKLKPLSTNHLSTRSFTTSVLSAEGWLRALRPPAGGFPLSQPLEPPDRHVRLYVEFPFPTHQELDHSADLSQVLGPDLNSLLLCHGLEV